MDEFSKYQSMVDAGCSPQTVYRQGKADGLNSISLIRLLRVVFRLSLPDAKQVTLIAEGLANFLDEHQDKLIPVVAEALAPTNTELNGQGPTANTEEAARPTG